MPRTIRFHETGGPEVLKIEEVPVPEPGAGEVRIRVRAIGLNRAESMFRSGNYVVQPVFPAGLGYEASGTIEALGEGVSGFEVGEPVSVIPAFAFNDYGLYGESALAPARALVKNPAGVGWVEAAATWMPFMTAWGALVDLAAARSGDVVVVPAASSSVGLAAIQVALKVGAIPVALTRTSAKAARLKELGAAHVIATTEKDLVDEVLRLTGGKGARIVFDPVGGPTFGQLAKATASGGILILYGVLSPEAAPLPVVDILGRHLTVRGYELFEVTMDDVKLARGKRFVLDGLADGTLRPIIAATYAFDRIVEAHRHLESNAQIGKIVVTSEAN